MATAANIGHTPYRRRRKKLSVGRVILIAFLILVCLFYLMPVYVMVINGFKSAANVDISRMWELPTSLTAGGYREAWSKLDQNMWTSLLLVVPATAISGILGALNGYLFSKWRFRGSDVVFSAILFGMFIPYQAVLIPLIKFLQWIHLYGTIPGLIVVHVIYGLPITTLIFRNFFTGIPGELIEAARVDGAGIVQIFRQIMLPLSIPAFVVVGIFQFTNIWNEFLFGLTVITNPARQPVTVALNNLSGSFSVSWNVMMAGAVIAALPTAIIYILLGKFFIRGMLAGSMKG